jgi:hypothetical protein
MRRTTDAHFSDYCSSNTRLRRALTVTLFPRLASGRCDTIKQVKLRRTQTTTTMERSRTWFSTFHFQKHQNTRTRKTRRGSKRRQWPSRLFCLWEMVFRVFFKSGKWKVTVTFQLKSVVLAASPHVVRLLWFSFPCVWVCFLEVCVDCVGVDGKKRSTDVEVPPGAQSWHVVRWLCWKYVICVTGPSPKTSFALLSSVWEELIASSDLLCLSWAHRWCSLLF